MRAVSKMQVSMPSFCPQPRGHEWFRDTLARIPKLPFSGRTGSVGPDWFIVLVKSRLSFLVFTQRRWTAPKTPFALLSVMSFSKLSNFVFHLTSASHIAGSQRKKHRQKSIYPSKKAKNNAKVSSPIMLEKLYKLTFTHKKRLLTSKFKSFLIRDRVEQLPICKLVQIF